MNNYKLIYDYKNMEEYRHSFNELANRTFGIDFERWYQKGFWNDSYVCYSYLDESRVVANISINKLEVLLEGQRMKALCLSTVMTLPEYRNRGLAASLMNMILEQHEKEYDFIYLSANPKVVDFYPKFGFTLQKEHQFIMELNSPPGCRDRIRKLNIDNTEDLKLIIRLASERVPVSRIFAVENSLHILLWYCVNAFRNSIYYLEGEDTIVVYEKEENKLHLYDIISRDRVSFKSVIDRIAGEETNRVIFYFTPDQGDVDTISIPCGPEDPFFVRPALTGVNSKFKYPITSQA